MSRAKKAVSRAWSWRHAITESDLPATTRHVLLTLSVFMDGAGHSCYPSVEDLADATGLSKRAIITHLAAACDAGWLARRPHGFRGQRWRRLEYEPLWPGREIDLPVSEEGGETASPPPEKAVNLGTEDGERRAPNVVNDVHQEIDQSIHHSKTSPETTRGGLSAAELDKLEAALREAGGEALDPTSTALMVLSDPIRWLREGCDLAMDVVPTIRSRAASRPQHSIRTWGFFTRAVVEARDRRLAGLPTSTGGSDGPRRDPYASRIDEGRMSQMIEEFDQQRTSA